MTLTLLLQLTDEEQLYAQVPVEPTPMTVEAPLPSAPESTLVELPSAEEEVG
jgi:hypothetical protein